MFTLEYQMVISFVSLLTLKCGTVENILNYDLETLLPVLCMRGCTTAERFISSANLHFIFVSKKGMRESVPT
jgi:hypothetical protein